MARLVRQADRQASGGERPEWIDRGETTEEF